MAKIKDIDKKILTAMDEEDLCIPQVTKIAHKTGLPTTTVHGRLNYLKQEKIIKSYSPILEPKELGAGFMTFVLGNLEDLEHPEIACQAIAKHPFVQGVYFLVGERDILVKIRSKDLEEYRENMKKLRKYIVGGGGIVVSEVFKDTQKFVIK